MGIVRALLVLLLAPGAALAAAVTYQAEVGDPSITTHFRWLLMTGDGKNVYASAGPFSNKLHKFDRDAGTGALTFDSVAASWGVRVGVETPDSEFLYVGAMSAIGVFDRDTATGALSHVQTLSSSSRPPSGIALSPGGDFVYVAQDGSTKGYIRVYARDLVTGVLTFVDVTQWNGASFRPGEMVISQDGRHLYAGDLGNAPANYEIQVFDRDLVTGEISFAQKVIGPDGAAVTKLHLDPTDQLLLAEVSDGQAVYSRDAVDGRLTLVDFQSDLRCAGGVSSQAGIQHFDTAGGRLLGVGGNPIEFVTRTTHSTGALEVVERLSHAGGDLGPVNLASGRGFVVSPAGDDLYMATGDDTIAHFEVGATPSVPLPVECLLEAKVTSIKSIAEGLRKGAKVVVKSLDVKAGVPGTDLDPTCNGDPPGTARATLRFLSQTSGEDTGEMPLPCERWALTGSPSSTKRGYIYKDSLREDGPCKLVKLKGGSSLKTTCDTKGPHPLDYDLFEGVDQGVVEQTLTIGTTKYCTASDDHKGKDGSDGKKFLGKNAPMPSACP